MHIKAEMLLMYLEVMKEGFFCLPGREEEVVCRKLLSLVKLYQRFWVLNIDQNLNISLLILPVSTVLF